MPGRLRIALQAAAVLVVALLLALLGWKVFNPDEAPDAGRPAPDFTLPHLNSDEQVSLASFRGKAVVLNFWASWCYPCKQEAPTLSAAAKRWPGRVVVLGVDVNDFAGDARKFARKYGLDYPLVHDNHNVTSPKYGLTGLPETFFLDRTGKVVVHVPGEVKAADIRDGVARALKS